MVVEAMAEKEDGGKSAARSASEALLDLCRGAKKKSVGMIGLNLLNPNFAPSLPKPTIKSILMLARRGMSAQGFRPVNRARARDANEKKAGDDDEEVRKKGNDLISLEKDMSEKVNDVNDKKILSNLNDVYQKCDFRSLDDCTGILGPASTPKI